MKALTDESISNIRLDMNNRESRKVTSNQGTSLVQPQMMTVQCLEEELMTPVSLL